MSELIKKHSEKLKNLSKDEKDMQLAKLYEQQQKMRDKSKAVTQKKKEQNIKRLSIDLHESHLVEFQELIQSTKHSKTELLLDMIQVYKQMLHSRQQKQQQQQSQQSPQQSPQQPSQTSSQGQPNPQQRK